MKRTDHENKDGCNHATIDTCRKNWCWLTQEFSSACFWETHKKCGGNSYNPNTGSRISCSCPCHAVSKKKKYLSPFTNTWV